MRHDNPSERKKHSVSGSESELRSEFGIYFIDRGAKPVATICFYDFATRRAGSPAPVQGDPEFVLTDGLSISPDGKWLLYAGGVSSSDIMLIDNFR